jgi:hypothetical protein
MEEWAVMAVILAMAEGSAEAAAEELITSQADRYPFLALVLLVPWMDILSTAAKEWFQEAVVLAEWEAVNQVKKVQAAVSLPLYGFRGYSKEQNSDGLIQRALS